MSNPDDGLKEAASNGRFGNSTGMLPLDCNLFGIWAGVN